MSGNVQMSPAIYRLPDVLRMIGLSRPSVYRMVRSGAFPKPVRLSPGAVGWMRNEVEEWLESRAGARNTASMAA